MNAAGRGAAPAPPSRRRQPRGRGGHSSSHADQSNCRHPPARISIRSVAGLLRTGKTAYHMCDRRLLHRLAKQAATIANRSFMFSALSPRQASEATGQPNNDLEFEYNRVGPRGREVARVT